ncbi:MAG: hypothetical protein ABMA64_25645 [Myxococcota bacterium]
MAARSVVVVEQNRNAGTRIARVLAAAAGFVPSVCGSDPEALKAELPSEPGLLGCDAADLPRVLPWLDLWPDLRLVVWSTRAPAELVALARNDPRIRSIVGWPSFGSTPRPFELGVIARRWMNEEALPPLANLLPWGNHVRTWRPNTSAARDGVVAEVGSLLNGVGVGPRTAAKASDVAHELLMNAMYVAPIDGRGEPKYARDRRGEVTLTPREVPTLRLAFDGQILVLEAQDPFGRLADHQVLDGVLRGFANHDAGTVELDVGRGGAGLGMAMVYASSVALMIEVRPGETTRVLWFHDVEIAPRDYRALPASLHLFRAGAASADGAGGWPS